MKFSLNFHIALILSYPPADDLENLSELVMIGDITNLKTQLQAIEAKEPVYLPFVKADVHRIQESSSVMLFVLKVR